MIPNIGGSLLAIHGVITRGLAVSLENAALYSQEGLPDVELRQGFADYVRGLSSIIHGHHLSEDDIVFPFLKTVIPEAPYEKLSSDHRLIEPMIQALDRDGGRLRSGGDEVLADMVSTLESLDGGTRTSRSRKRTSPRRGSGS